MDKQIMEYLNRDRYRMAAFERCVKTPCQEPVMMPLKTCNAMLDGYQIFQPKVTGHYFQPPRFIVGGFVGSKVCENKNGSGNYSNLLGQIINIITTFKPTTSPSTSIRSNGWSKNSDVTSGKNCVKVSTPVKSDPSSPLVIPPIVIQTPSAPKLMAIPDSPLQMDTSKLSPACRTVSESSDTSWASSDPSESRVLFSSNPWVSSMVVCVSDDSDDDSDDGSDWDCVDDYQSENGEVISDFKWQGDHLSPITSPTTRTPPASMPDQDYDDYDSDESEGVLISCGPYVVDDEEEAKEREAAEERIQAVNLRWEQGLADDDETDGKWKKAAQNKQVHFASKLVHVRPMLTWSHAYRSARKGDWERLARDAERFRERIDAASVVISPVLDPSHRERVRTRLQLAAN